MVVCTGCTNHVNSGVLENAMLILAYWKTPDQFWRIGKRQINSGVLENAMLNLTYSCAL
jgi:hypothetical protein